MANPVAEDLSSFQPDHAGNDSNQPVGASNAGIGQSQDVSGNLRLLKSVIRGLSIHMSWERWLGVKNLAGTANIAFTFSSGTVFTVNDNFSSSGRNIAVVGRRVRATLAASTIYGTISSAGFTAVTTITVVWDSGSLTNPITEIEFGLEPNALMAHRARHISGGADAFLSTDLLEAIVKRLQESGGQTLTVGSITDGQWLKRSGTTVIGFTVDENSNAYGVRRLQTTAPANGDYANGDITYVY